MNTIHNNGNGDNTLHDDLDRIDDAYKHLEQQEPPELLDRAVLNSAHRAVEKKTGWMQFGWLHGLTTAAVVIVAISVVLQQREPAPVFEDSTGITLPAPSTPQKAVEDISLQESTPPPRREVSKDDTPTARQKMAASASPVITENEAASIDQLQSRASSDEPAAAASGVIYENVSEFRLDADKKEIMVKGAADDELDAMTEVVEEEVSHDIDRAAKRELMQPIDITMTEELEKIIALKDAGDESWQTALQAFKQRYPDYPIPEDLEP